MGSASHSGAEARRGAQYAGSAHNDRAGDETADGPSSGCSDIAALEPPADIAGDVRDYLAEGDDSVMMIQKLYDRVMGGEDITAAEAATLGTDEGQASIAAGLEACAS